MDSEQGNHSRLRKFPELNSGNVEGIWMGDGACLPWVLLGTCGCYWLLVSNWNGEVVLPFLLLRGLVLSALTCLWMGAEGGLTGHVPLWNIVFEDFHAEGPVQPPKTASQGGFSCPP